MKMKKIKMLLKIRRLIKKPKMGINLIDTKKKNLEFPVLPSPITDTNESAKLTAQEFAKAVGIKILHKTDEEEDEECDCEYCRAANLNTVNTIKQNYNEENGCTMQQIPNVTLNQYSHNSGSTSSLNNSNTLNNENSSNYNIPPFPAFNMNFCNDKLSKCSSNSSLNSNHSIVNSRTIGTPGYNCHRSRKNSISKVVDMSLFVPPTEEEIRRVHSSSLSINSTPESSSIQIYASNDKIMGGSLDRNRNHGYNNFNNYKPIATRERSISTSIASTSRNNAKIIKANDIKISPNLRESNIGQSSRIQFKSCNRCDSGTELSNVHITGNPSSPIKRPYPNSLASSSSSTTLSSALSLTHITQSPSLGHISSSQSGSSQASIQKNQITKNLSLQSVKYSPKSSNISSPYSSAKSSSSVATPIKPHSSFKITRSVTISEGTRCAEIDLQPIQPDEIKVYTKGRFTITCEHSRRPSAPLFSN